MDKHETINYYCFNKQCKNSIFNADTCVVREIPLAPALTEEQFCECCAQPLVAKPLIRIARQVNELLSTRFYTSLIIDDDPNYHITARELFKNAKNFNESKHLTNATDALNYLTSHKDNPHLIPDCIFLDVNMPAMDAWEFLEEFQSLSPLLKKKVDIYIISSDIHPVYHERIKAYPNVKGLISKNFGLNFLNNITN